MNTTCTVYRCAQQSEMYLYLRTGLATESLPATLLRITGKLTQVMDLDLDQRQSLARVDVTRVRHDLFETGYYLQMPPGGLLDGHLRDGD
ncbi:MAG: YcgL domain-containing protein [Stenotrophobium sp.]